MKKVAAAVVVVILLLAAAAWFTSRREQEKTSLPRSTPLETAKKPVPAQAVIANSTFHALFRPPRKLIDDGKSKVAVSAPAVDPGCRKSWESILRLDLSNWIYPPKVEALSDLPSCASLPKEFKGVHAEYMKQCEAFFRTPEMPASKEDWDRESRECLIALIFYRSRITDWSTKESDLSRITDLAVLGDKLLSSVQDVFYGENIASADRAIAVAERILEIDPRLYEAAKMASVSELMKALHNVETGAPVNWDRAEAAYRRVMELNPSAQDMEEMGLFIRSKGLRADLLHAEAEAFLRANPSSGVGEYYLASLEWNAGNRAGALDFLSRSLAKNPGDDRFKSTLSKIQDNNLPVGTGMPFEFHFGLTLNSRDFVGR